MTNAQQALEQAKTDTRAIGRIAKQFGGTLSDKLEDMVFFEFPDGSKLASKFAGKSRQVWTPEI